MQSGPALFQQLINVCYDDVVKTLKPEQELLVTKYHLLLAEKDGLANSLEPLFPYYDVKYTIDFNQDFQTNLHNIDCLRQRVHIAHFFLTHILPEKLENETQTQRLLHLFMGDLQQLTECLAFLYSKNQVPLGHSQTIVNWLHLYDLSFQFWLPKYKPLSSNKAKGFYNSLVENALNYIQPLIIHGNTGGALERVKMARQHIENARKYFASIRLPIKQIRLLQDDLKKKVDHCESKIPAGFDPFTEDGATVKMYQILLTFEKQFPIELASFSQNKTLQKLDTKKVTNLSEQINSAILELTNPEIGPIFWIMISMKLTSTLALLSQVDQLYHTDEAKELFPLLRTLIQTWQKLFKKPNPLMKLNLEILNSTSSLLATQMLTISGITPKVPVITSTPFSLTLPPPKIESKEAPEKKETVKPVSQEFVEKVQTQAQTATTVDTQTTAQPAVLDTIPKKSKRSAARKRAAERKKANHENEQVETLTAALGSLALNDLQPVKDKTIALTPEIIAILDKLEAAGFKAYVKGGYVRDTLLGCTPNDIDFVSDCPKEKVCEILGAQFSRNFLIKDKIVFQAKGMELACSSNTLLEEANSSDITINALFADKSGNIFDPLDKIGDLDKPVLETVGDPQTCLQDPKRLLRMPRIGIHIGKTIPLATIECMQQLMKTVNSLEFVVYRSNMTKLFCYGKGALAWDFFERNQLMNDLLNIVPKTQTSAIFADPAIRFYVHSKFLQFDQFYSINKTPANVYHVLAALLLPELIITCQSLPGTMVNETIDVLLEAFCKRIGVMCEADRTCFKKSTQVMLVHYYGEFLTTKAQMAHPVVPKVTQQTLNPPRARIKMGQTYTPGYQASQPSYRSAKLPTLGDFMKEEKPIAAKANK